MKRVNVRGVVGGQDCGLSTWDGETSRVWTPDVVTRIDKAKDAETYLLDDDEDPPEGWRWLIVFHVDEIKGR